MDPSTRSDDNFAPARRGARWREAAIVLLASAAIVWIILGTVRSELQKARMRFAEDTLAHLAGQVTLAMQRASDRGEDPRAWSFPLLGPGAEGSAVLGTPLELVLPAGSWLPRDPWGRGFRVLLAGEDPRRYPLLVCGGPDDRFDPERPDPRWSQPILWPEPPR